MARVTNKFQVTVPKALADQVGIRPGDEIELVPGDRSLKIVLPAERTQYSVEDRLRLFDLATQRQRDREKQGAQTASGSDRGWRREDLYTRGLPD